MEYKLSAVDPKSQWIFFSCDNATCTTHHVLKDIGAVPYIYCSKHRTNSNRAHTVARLIFTAQQNFSVVRLACS